MFDPQKHRILVTTPCSCGASKWYNCGCSQVVAKYEWSGADGVEPSDPPLDVLKEIRNRHPGMTLIY